MPPAPLKMAVFFTRAGRAVVEGEGFGPGDLQADGVGVEGVKEVVGGFGQERGGKFEEGE